MISSQNNFLTSFFKASLITALMIGALLAQSYATTTLFTVMPVKVAVEINSTENSAVKP